ncbi:hypothetical protein OA101_00175 [Alphaproteobacteria bacterium]|nr:hypothetical protein [Alphaproteobacteria bacterium]
MNKYLISGIAPGKGGVGALVKSLDSRRAMFNYESIYVRNPKVSIGSLLKERKITDFLFESILWVWSLFSAQIRMLTMRNNRVILIYPQYFNSYVLTTLVKNNEVALYVMDNSFFCIKSNNYLEGKECMKCINGTINIDKSCSPLSKISSTRSAINKINKIKSISPDLYFLAQNYQQLLLLKKTFGDSVKGNVVGMDTGEFGHQSAVINKQGYDIVYHGSNSDAKGVMYVLELAKHLKQYSFLLPISPNVKQLQYSNVHYKECTWSSGLKEYTANARLVLCPSIYSSPVEGSLLKSIAYNGNVAVFDNSFGFQNDIDSKVLLRLNSNISVSSNIIDEFIRSSSDKSFYAKKWLESYCSNLNDENIFEWDLNSGTTETHE